MKTIHKFPLLVVFTEQTIEIPFCSNLIKFNLQNNTYPVLYFIVDTNAILIKRNFILIFTNKPIPENSNYIDTFEIENLIYHLFELL